MKLKLTRTSTNAYTTIGKLYVNGQFECFTLEDSPILRVDNKGPIPVGEYSVIIDFSDRFQRYMPHVLNVPGFTGIRIHKGNTHKDTEGCILVGLSEGIDSIHESKAAFDALFLRLRNAEAHGEDITLEVTNA